MIRDNDGTILYDQAHPVKSANVWALEAAWRWVRRQFIRRAAGKGEQR